MTMNFVGLSFALAAGLATPTLAAEYPTKAVHVIVPLPAGSAADGVARIVLPAAEKYLGQPFIIENEGGAASIPGTSRAAKAEPDGYTLVWGTVATHVSNPNMFKALPYNPGRDFTAVARVGGQSMFMAVPKASGIDSVAKFVEKAKKVDNLAYASAGIGTSAHLCAELLKLRTGIKLRHIPYQGGAQPVLDLMRGETNMMFYSLSQFQPGLQSGDLKLLGVAADKRSKFLPDLPTLKEQGYDVVLTSWYGVYARTGTPPAVVDKLAGAINKALKDPAVVEALEKTGTEVFTTETPAEYQAFTEFERARYGEIISAAGIPKS